jgi:FMN phosphatase YigB (HAD superfamily)
MIISFDFWATIANSNPQFKQGQTNLIEKNSEIWWKTKKDITKSWDARHLDYKTLEGKYPKREDFYVGLEETEWKGRLPEFLKATDELFQKYPPIAIEDTVRCIRELSALRDKGDNKDFKIGIVSNTSSIMGLELRTYLFHTLKLKLDFFNFSDELKISKPNPEIFNTRFGKVNIHVGNDPKFDNVEGVTYVDVLDIFNGSNSNALTPLLSPEKPEVINEFRYAEHSFSSEEDINFSLRDYSKLKYGSGRIARKFGKEIARGLVNSIEFDRFIKAVGTKSIIMSSSPYKHIPPAARVLKEYISRELNTLMDEKDLGVVNNFKLYRKHSYTADYGSMTKEDRTDMLKSDGFHADKEFIKGKALIIVDDVSITGSHEDLMRSILNSHGFEGPVLYLYYADFIGEGHPNIENILNFAAIDMGSVSIDAIIANEDFVFNTRVTKYIMGLGQKIFREFIITKNATFVEELYHNVLCNDYAANESFKDNLLFLKTVI